MKRFLFLPLVIGFAGCAAPNGHAPLDPPFVITTSDIAQADWVESVVAKTPGAKYQVQPRAQSVLVTFYMEITKEQEAAVRENMQRMKADLERQFKKANTLVFRFKNVELKQ